MDDERNYYVHETAIVEDNVQIGEKTKIWVNAQIRTNVKIGYRCIVGKDTFIDEGVRVGNGVKIQNGVSIYHGVTIGDRVFIGPNAVFTNDMYPRAFVNEWKVFETNVEEGASIGANATIVCGSVIGKFSMVGAGSVVTKNVPPHALVIGNPARIVGYVCECGRKLKNGKCELCGFKLGESEK